MQRALDALWRFTGELFEPVEGWRSSWPRCTAHGWTSVRRARPRHPDPARGAAARRLGGRRRAQGLHTEPFGRMLAEMQHLHRSHPGASW